MNLSQRSTCCESLWVHLCACVCLPLGQASCFLVVFGVFLDSMHAQFTDFECKIDGLSRAARRTERHCTATRCSVNAQVMPERRERLPFESRACGARSDALCKDVCVIHVLQHFQATHACVMHVTADACDCSTLSLGNSTDHRVRFYTPAHARARSDVDPSSCAATAAAAAAAEAAAAAAHYSPRRPPSILIHALSDGEQREARWSPHCDGVTYRA